MFEATLKTAFWFGIDNDTNMVCLILTTVCVSFDSEKSTFCFIDSENSTYFEEYHLLGYDAV
jgi:hypothetical protein